MLKQMHDYLIQARRFLSYAEVILSFALFLSSPHPTPLPQFTERQNLSTEKLNGKYSWTLTHQALRYDESSQRNDQFLYLLLTSLLPDKR